MFTVARQRTGYALFLSLLAIELGCGSSHDESGPGSTQVTISPAVPDPTSLAVSVGALASAHPGANGTVAIGPPIDRTSTTILVSADGKTPMLLAVNPARWSTDAATPATVTPQSTIEALIFYRLGGWLLPQESHLAALQTIHALPEVGATGAAFAQAYAANPNALSSLAVDPVLLPSLQAAVDAAATALASVPSLAGSVQQLDGGILDAALPLDGAQQSNGATLGTQQTDGTLLSPDNRMAPRIFAPTANTWTVSPSTTAGVSVSASGVVASATNNMGIYRGAQVKDSTGSSLGWVVLPDKTAAVPLRPNPLPDKSPLDVIVTGGIVGYNSNLDPIHLVPIGLTVALDVVAPLLSAITGVTETSVDPQASGFDVASRYHTGHAFVDELLNVLLGVDGPVVHLIQTLAVKTTNGQSLEAGPELITWTRDDLLPALALDLSKLATAALAEYGGKIQSAAFSQLLGAFASPEVLGILKAIRVGRSIISAGQSSQALLAAPWEAHFRLSSIGQSDAGTQPDAVSCGSLCGSPCGPRTSTSFNSDTDCTRLALKCWGSPALTCMDFEDSHGVHSPRCVAWTPDGCFSACADGEGIVAGTGTDEKRLAEFNACVAETCYVAGLGPWKENFSGWCKATRTGGASGAGGARASGGATGTGGASGAGGARASGGATGTGGASGAGGARASGGAKGSGGALGPGGAGGTGGEAGSGGATGAAGLPNVEASVDFNNGQARGAMTGWGWVSLGSADTLTSPTCDATAVSPGTAITARTPCSTTTSWSRSDALCISGSIPSLPGLPTSADFTSNWGVQLGVNATNEYPSGSVGKSFSSMALTFSGSPTSGVSAELHLLGDATGTVYCYDNIKSGQAYALTEFNTACWDGSGTSLKVSDTSKIDRIALQIASTDKTITISNFCLAGISFR